MKKIRFKVVPPKGLGLSQREKNEQHNQIFKRMGITPRKDNISQEKHYMKIDKRGNLTGYLLTESEMYKDRKDGKYESLIFNANATEGQMGYIAYKADRHGSKSPYHSGYDYFGNKKHQFELVKTNDGRYMKERGSGIGIYSYDVPDGKDDYDSDDPEYAPSGSEDEFDGGKLVVGSEDAVMPKRRKHRFY